MNTAEKVFDKSTKFLEWLLFQSRWLLFPLYAGLAAALVFYDWCYFHELWTFVRHTPDGREKLLPVFLGLVDIVMTGSLMVMIYIGSYAIFIQKFVFKENTKKPQWLDHINAGTLKVKAGMSLIGVSSIHMYQDFVSAAATSWDTILKRISIHGMFVISVLVLALADKIMHPVPSTQASTSAPSHEKT